MKLFHLLTISLTFLWCAATTASVDGELTSGGVVKRGSSPVDEDAPDPESPKSASRLNVHKLQDEDNLPNPPHHKSPLDPYKTTGDEDGEAGASEVSYDSFFMSISMIVVSEIGDKTFLIAALMAMRNSRIIVFSAAFSSLVVMTVLSGIVGHALPTLFSQRLTQLLASGLFIVFGFKLLREGLEMSKELGVEEELAEVEEELASSNLNHQLDDIEAGNSTNPDQSSHFKPKSNSSTSYLKDFGDQLQNLASFILSPVWIQVFVMTFLGEWGDRSQIATIAMAAGSDYWLVILGAIVGHGLCTAAACLGGKLLAKRISMRNVTLGGAIAFFLFAVLYFYDAYYNVGENA